MRFLSVYDDSHDFVGSFETYEEASAAIEEELKLSFNKHLMYKIEKYFKIADVVV